MEYADIDSLSYLTRRVRLISSRNTPSQTHTVIENPDELDSFRLGVGTRREVIEQAESVTSRGK